MQALFYTLAMVYIHVSTITLVTFPAMLLPPDHQFKHFHPQNVSQNAPLKQKLRVQSLA